ncbi:ParB/RepB/Spo0J family partition protein [Marinicella gelatinilytica]|uniref:ParB/RepB/Spo0J family partition protein n=1 Tax=Marinicella gelatinilytica TaxID=2996017 RepID=UPI002260D971|nr:ParB/RepB/Spo0J family partition protein [Marinicella gelatinilytica]MCX7544209.1 ParB/RepB/Spo0J family partition protein [Marinicella gelatinilytica]
MAEPNKPNKKVTKKTKRKTGLGRGLDALLASSKNADATKSDHDVSELQTLAVNQLQPGQYQPRTIMDEDKLRELADSIESQGIVQPIVVRQISSRKYEIVAGERRWRAAKMAKLTEVPVLVKQIDDQQTIAMALIENIQREDLNPLEEAQALARLIKEFSITHAQAAEAVGRSRVAVSNLLRLLDLSDQVKQLLNQELLEMGHARCLLGLDKTQQSRAAEQIVAKKLTVRQAEALVKEIKNPTPKKPPEINKKNADVRHLEQQLSEQLCTKVLVQQKSGGKGQLVIHYHDADELQGILERIK